MAVRHGSPTVAMLIKVLEQFKQRILRAILGVHWQDRMTKARILEQADTTSIEAHIARSQLSWTGHVIYRVYACQIPEHLNSNYAPSFHPGSGKLADSGTRLDCTSLDWRLSLCWENSRKRSTTTFHQRDKYFFCIYCIHKLFKLTFAYICFQ